MDDLYCFQWCGMSLPVIAELLLLCEIDPNNGPALLMWSREQQTVGVDPLGAWYSLLSLYCKPSLSIEYPQPILLRFSVARRGLDTWAIAFTPLGWQASWLPALGRGLTQVVWSSQGKKRSSLLCSWTAPVLIISHIPLRFYLKCCPGRTLRLLVD